jgi:hypothetical protein
MTATAADMELEEQRVAEQSDAADAPPRDAAGLTATGRAIVALSPVAFTLLCVALMVPRQTRVFYDWLISENRPVEMATFLCAIVAAWQGARMVVALSKRRHRFAAGFYLLFALGMFFIGMEEIAWGQQFFHWQTPAELAAINKQDETTLHNLGPLQGHNDFLRLAFGFGGLIGVVAAPLLPKLRVLFPHRALLMWFAIIAGCSVVQIYADIWPNGPGAQSLDKIANRLAEVVEMYIAIAAVLYLWLNRRQFIIKPAAV